MSSRRRARIDLDQYESDRRRNEKMAAEMAADTERARQIATAFAYNHSMYSPDDPEYWDPDPWEVHRLYRSWKVL